MHITYPSEVSSGQPGVTLNASATTPVYAGIINPVSSIASYAWTQTAGPAVALNGENTAVCTFAAPVVADNTELEFRLTVSDDVGLTSEGTVTIMVAVP